MEYIAAYDFGTSGVKCAFVSRDGRIAAVQEKAYPLLRPAPLFVEQDPETFWNAVCEVTHRALEQSGLEPAAVKGLSFSVQAVTLIPVDADGNVLHNAISWLDGRAEKQANAINARAGMELVRRQDYQPRILWLKENMPELYDKTAFFLECDGFLQYRSTGVMAVPPDHPGLVQYPPEYEIYQNITLANIDRSKLPPLVQPCRVFGRLDENGARELGLCPGTPVFGGMVDVPAAAAGCGCLQTGEAHVYLGSSAWLSVVTDRLYDASPGAYQLNSILPDRYIYGGCSNCCGILQNWAVGRFYRNEAAAYGSAFFPWLEEQLRAVPAGCGGLYTGPWLYGEQFPIQDPSVRGVFFNVTEEHTEAHFLQSVREGICFSMRGQMETYHRDTGLTVGRIGANGGCVQSDGWMQMMADVLGVPVTVQENARHSGCVGAAIAAAIGLGWYSVSDVSSFIRIEKTFEPNPENKTVYDEKSGRWMELYHTTKDLYRILNGV